MLDLNLSFVHEDTITAVRGEIEESGTSNSSIVNAEGCSSSNVGGDDSVSVAGDGDNFHCFNFDILKVGDTSVLLGNSIDEDQTSQFQTQAQTQTQTRSEFVTRTLFPVSHEEGTFNLGHQVNSLLHVQQNKPTVQQNQAARKSRRGPRSRSSQYRGVTFYRRTGRWESHIWDCGKQVYLGGFDTAHAAARAYDRAAIKFRGVDADINFNISDYEEDMNQIKNLSKEDFVHILRRHNSGFSRGGSRYRGVTLNNCGLLEASMGQFLGKKAYDKAAMKSNTYEGETVASHCGNRHNLDLNLRMSTPSCHGKGSTRNDNMEHMQLKHGLQAGNASTTSTLKGLPVVSEHGQTWTGIYPQIIGGSSQGASNCMVKVKHRAAMFTAASSGFPAPAPPNYLNYN